MFSPEPDMSGLTPASQQLSPSQPYPIPYPGSRELTRTCSTPSPDISDLLALSRVKCLGPGMSSPQAGFQRQVPDMSGPDPNMSGSLTP
jgi:hypothetical protein